MLSQIIVFLGILALLGSLLFNAIAGAQVAVIGSGLVLVGIFLELKTLNRFNDERKKSAQQRQAKSQQ